MSVSMEEDENELGFSRFKPLGAILLFISIAGFSASQVIYAIQALVNAFDFLWLLELLFFGFLFILSFAVLFSIIYLLDRSQGRVKKRIAFVESLFGDQNE
ncbi:MAG: hypothetical protein ACE5IO_03675 [Thermoplasmata archaeon]